MKRSTLTFTIVVPVLALLLFQALVPTSGTEYAWLGRFTADRAAERESFERWFAASGTMASLRLDLEQVEAVAKADEARGTARLSARLSAAGSSVRTGPGTEALTISAEPRVGDEARERVTDAVRRELAALGVPTPLHPVMVVLSRDSTVRFHYRRTVVLPRESGAPCTVVLRERGRSPQFAGIAADDRVLGACAFFAAYGEPGRGMLEWLSETRMRTAAYLLTDNESAETTGSATQATARNSSRDVAACRAGLADGCMRLFNAEEVESPSGMRAPAPTFYLDGVASYNPNSLRAGSSQSAATDGLLSGLEDDLGPAAFARVWASDSNPAVAYEAETGEPLHAWVGRHLGDLVTEYQAGPLPPMSKMTLLVVLMAAIVTATVRLTRRRLS